MGLLLASSIAPSHLGSGDSVQPRDTEAVIDTVAPALPSGVRVDIVGSDTFVRVRSTGHSVEVAGYEGEPYMRIAVDGTVEVNDGSVTSVLNGDRFGNVDLSNFEPTEKPVWREVSTNGTAMWHDHRSHWMSPKPPAAIDASGKVQTFSIPLAVDGVATTVTGTLYLRDRASAAWWLVGATGMMVALIVTLMRRGALWIVLGAVSVLGFAVGVQEWAGLPVGARVTPVLSIFTAAAMLVVATALAVRRFRRAHLVPVMNAGAAATMLTAVWLCSDQVTAAYVPGLDTAWQARAVIPLMLGASLVALIDGVMSVTRRTPAV